MREYRENGITMVLVSHLPELIASLCERALWLDKGKIIA